MQDQDERHAGVARQRVEELVERLQAPGRGAETDHQEVVAPQAGVTRRLGSGGGEASGAGFSRHGLSCPAEPFVNHEGARTIPWITAAASGYHPPFSP